MKPYGAEFFGTFWLMPGDCGSAVLAMAFPKAGIGHISGCHLDPAVSIGLWAGGRFPAAQLAPYIAAQVLGGLVAVGVLYIIASGQAGFGASTGFAYGYGEHPPGGYSPFFALVREVVITAMFLLIILGSTSKRVPHDLRDRIVEAIDTAG